MRRVILQATLAGLCGAATAGLMTQSGGAAQKVDVVAVAGCVAQEGESWLLTSATEPLAAPAPGGARQSAGVREGSAPSAEEGALSLSLRVTAEMASQQPPGAARYRLIGLFDEFNVASHKGHKVLVRGPLISDAKEKRVNVMSLVMVAPVCATGK